MSQIELRSIFSIVLSTQVALFIGLITWRYLARRRQSSNAALRTLLNQYTASEISEFDTNLAKANSARTGLSSWFLYTSYGRWFNSACIRAGYWSEDQVSIWTGRKFEWSIAGVILSMLGMQLVSTPTYLLVLLPILGFIGPDLLLFSRGKERGERIARALPETIDLLNMTVGAGLGFQAGLDRISRSEGNPLSDEFRRVLAEIRLGDSRTHAFTSMAERINRPEIWSFTNAISQVEKLGIPITSALKDQAKMIRAERREKAREIAQKLPVKILAPIMLLLLPSVLVIVLGPAIFTIMGSL
jgi:tight adherence protein C